MKLKSATRVNSFILVIYIAIIGCDSTTLCDGIHDALFKEKLGTKTGYFSAVKDESLWEKYRDETLGCSPVKVWFFARHGTRYPVHKDFANFEKLPQLSEEILYNHLQGRGCLSEEDVFEFKKWIPSYGLRDKGQLHSAGYEELYSIGERWKNLFPLIFDGPYNATKIKVDFTVRNRTGQSAYHFLRGMFGDDEIGNIKLPEPYTPNFILRFYKSCPLWLREVYRSEKTYHERKLFEKGPEFHATVSTISSRLGYIHPLSVAQIGAMYDECRYEAAWWPDIKSIWCTPFSKKDIEVLEYHQDLKYYYEDSYGTPMNKDMACKTIGDLFGHFRTSVLSNDAMPKGILYFSHDKAILKIQAALGLFQPQEKLLHSNFEDLKSRVFRTSKVAAFASNLGFVLYRCGEDHKVSLFFQGSPMMMKHVCPTLLCDWEQFQGLLKPIYQNCDLTKTCMLHDEL